MIGGGDWAVDRIVPDLARGAHRGVGDYPAARCDQAVAARARTARRLSTARTSCVDRGPGLLGRLEFRPDPEDELVPFRAWSSSSVTMAGAPCRISDGRRRSARSGGLRLDCTKARNESGLAAGARSGRALDMTAAWYREAASGSAADITERQIEAYEQLLYRTKRSL